jgi:hypothetical protein
VLCLGYALAMQSSSNETIQNNYPYVGEWHSQVITPLAKYLCFELDVFAPIGWQLSIDLLTSDINDQQNTQTKTVFEVSDIGDEQIKLLSELDIGFNPNSTSLVQLVVYMTANMTLQNVNFKPSSCQMQSMCE